jgi:hypothetical protein
MNLSSLGALSLPHPVRIGGNEYDAVFAGPRGAVSFNSVGDTWSQPLNDELAWEIPNIAVFTGNNSSYNFDADTALSATPMTWGYLSLGLEPALCVTWTGVHPWVPVPSLENTPEYPDVWNWIDRGHWDETKSNTFQVVIMPGYDDDDAWTLILNYDTIQWQSYEEMSYLEPGTLKTVHPSAGFTGGTNTPGSWCTGNYACWLGYITGRDDDGTRIPSLDWLDYPLTHFEFDEEGGSGFLDSAPGGLAVTRTNSNQYGRHVFEIVERGEPVATEPDIYDEVPAELVGKPWRSSDNWLELTRYVALGDSYQSGEGASPFYTETDIDSGNQCHRSPDAYPVLLANSPIFENEFWGSPPTLEFWACSGAVVKDMWNTWPSDEYIPYHETTWADDRGAGSIPNWRTTSTFMSQMDRLTEDTAVVTLGIGGNDLGFVPILQACLLTDTATVVKMASDLVGPVGVLPGMSCQKATNAYFDANFTNLIIPSADRPDQDWESLLEQVHQRSPQATVIVVGYPRLFPEQYSPFDGTIGDYCHGLLRSSQLYLNDLGREVANLEQRWAMKNGAIFVNPAPLFHGNELCSSPDDQAAINGIVPFDARQSFHPNARGHRILANAIVRTLFKTRGTDGAEFLQLGQTHTYTIDVPEALDLYLSLGYPGSDLPMTLTSPSGRVITRDTVAGDIESSHGATWESYVITEAEVGTWTVEIYGAEVNEGGEPYTFDYLLHDSSNTEPVPDIALTRAGDTVHLDATGSTDDGEILDYRWFFDEDGEASGATTSHTFSQPGEYHVILRVEDNRGASAWATYPTTIVVSDDSLSSPGGPAEAESPPRSEPISPVAPTPELESEPGPEDGPIVASPSAPASDDDASEALPPGAQATSSSGLAWWLWVVIGLVAAAGLATVIVVRRRA